MTNNLSDVIQVISKVATKKVLIYSLAQRMLMGIFAGLVGPLIPIIAELFWWDALANPALI